MGEENNDDLKINNSIESPDKFNIAFHNQDGEEVGKLVVFPDKPVEFKGDLDESAEAFFQHLKTKIDRYIKNG